VSSSSTRRTRRSARVQRQLGRARRRDLLGRESSA
jgi:hypothetical protein